MTPTSPPPMWPPPPVPRSRVQSLVAAWWQDVSPAGSRSRALRLVRATLLLQGCATSAVGVVALLLAAVLAAFGTQWLLLGGACLAVGALSTVITAGMSLASTRLGELSGRARYITAWAELLIFTMGVVMVGLTNDQVQRAGTAASPGTDGPFADGEVGLIYLTGMAYVVGAIVVASLLLLAPSIRRAFREPPAAA